jgi:branched-chain amino acid transport system substrate-binding protein
VATVMKPAGLENGQDILTAGYLKDPTNPLYANDKDFHEWKAFMQKYYPNGNTADGFNAYAYAVSTLLVHVLKQCGDDLTRANIMKQAASVKGLQLPMVIEGIKVNTSATDFYPVQAVKMHRFKGETFQPFGEVISAEAPSQ